VRIVTLNDIAHAGKDGVPRTRSRTFRHLDEEVAAQAAKGTKAGKK
jgi:hypothetical protein